METVAFIGADGNTYLRRFKKNKASVPNNKADDAEGFSLLRMCLQCPRQEQCKL